ncbi:hypothetical protein [Actinotalea fermentans]|uniref:Uncharacterized protein n=1 Tax=Actinotalea fermentans TaxID=43671 RepID=A0A511YZB5_9CELL|nr:hypothetical protein [Actinotalea fermentans]KGM15454.1 hypothetical protein N867_08315 [Actinotalea fermentans ATCC 43279 = JCM 9966 = DSM 3133]GEN80549.1 hypothetical protein AFE02nite_22830 [Actinotalea fermentans]
MSDLTPDAVATRGDEPAASAEDVVGAGVAEGAPADSAPVEAPEAEAPDTPARPAPARPRADLVALVVATVLPVLGVLLTLTAETWLTVAFLMLVPAIVVVYGLGLLVLVRVLRRRSMLRRELGDVPLRYRVYAWAWAIGFLAAAVSPMLGGLDLPWVLQAAVVGASPVAVGVLTGGLWSAYLRDVAWVEAQNQD